MNNISSELFVDLVLKQFLEITPKVRFRFYVIYFDQLYFLDSFFSLLFWNGKKKYCTEYILAQTGSALIIAGFFALKKSTSWHTVILRTRTHDKSRYLPNYGTQALWGSNPGVRYCLVPAVGDRSEHVQRHPFPYWKELPPEVRQTAWMPW